MAVEYLSIQMKAHIGLNSGKVDPYLECPGKYTRYTPREMFLNMDAALDRNPEKPIKMGEIITFKASDLVELRINITNITSSHAYGSAEFFIPVRPGMEDGHLCPVCGRSGDFALNAAVKAKMGDNGEIQFATDENGNVILEDTTEFDCPCGLKGLLPLFSPAYWLKILPQE